MSSAKINFNEEVSISRSHSARVRREKKIVIQDATEARNYPVNSAECWIVLSSDSAGFWLSLGKPDSAVSRHCCFISAFTSSPRKMGQENIGRKEQANTIS